MRPSLAPGDADRLCIERAAMQEGVLTMREALDCGLTVDAVYRRVRSGLWSRILPGVFRVCPGTSVWRQQLLALTRWSSGVASHRSAAALHRLDGFCEDVLEVECVRYLRAARSNVVVHRVSQLPLEIVSIEGIPTVGATRTLLQVAGLADPRTVELGLEDALRRRLTSLPRLRWMLDREGRGCRGAATLRELVAALDATGRVTESGFEARLCQELRRAGLPRPVRQHEIEDRGALVARVDFAYPRARVALEAASYRWHSGRTAWGRDQKRYNQIVALGWRVIVVTWDDLRDHASTVVEQIRQALAR